MFICSENNFNAIKATVLAWNATLIIGTGLAANVITRKLCKALDTIESSPEFKKKMDEQVDMCLANFTNIKSLCKKNMARCGAAVNTICNAGADVAQKHVDECHATAESEYQHYATMDNGEFDMPEDAVDDDFDFNDRVD